MGRGAAAGLNGLVRARVLALAHVGAEQRRQALQQRARTLQAS